MVKHFSILHISDLHKPENCNLDNLFYSIQRDSEAYTKEGVRKPEIVVVSGDIADGVKDSGSDAETIIMSQYKEAGKFLKALTDYFLDGDKSRMIIVPGNHDYCYKTSKNSMSPSPKEKAKDDYKLLKVADPLVRWNWDDKQFYYITDRDLYKTRFDLFKAFYNDFYKGIRELPLNVESDSYIVEIERFKIAFVCFNSCYRLDHLNPMGCICPDAIAQAHERLVKLKNQGFLLAGVWHHHVSGLPAENNYMDYRILNAMMQEDIKLGLFGHQHVSTAVQEYSEITSKKSILLISSGCLYGNRYQLVTGVPRQYNVIEVRMDNEEVTLQLNVRKDNSLYGYDIPQWGVSPLGMKNLHVYEHKLRIEKPQVEYLVEDIEKMVRQSDNYEAGCLRLKELGLDNELVLKYFDSYIPKVKDIELLHHLLRSPRTIVQYMTALDAAVEQKDKHWIKQLLSDERFKNDTNPFLNELKEQANKMI